MSRSDVGDQRSWRPQGFGIRHRARDIPDPIIEPLWPGIRVLVHLGGGSIEIDDELGEPIADQLEPLEVEQLHAIEASLREQLLAESAVFDGYLTAQATRPTVGAAITPPEGPSATDMAGQMLMGSALRPRGPRGAEIDPTPAADLAGTLAFVAVDLLALDGDPLLDVPLLERKRLLESALNESELVRRSAYVRPPIDTWLVSWRALGFSALAYKAANSRYEPGEPNDGWATAAIPRQ